MKRFNFITLTLIVLVMNLYGCKGASVKGAGSGASTVPTTSQVFDPEAPVAKILNIASFDEDTQSIITLSYTDPKNKFATSCNVTSTTNLTVSQNCSCSAQGVCTVGIKGVQNYNGAANFEYTVANGLHVSLPAKNSLTILPVNDAPVVSLSSTNVSGNDNSTLPSVVATITDIDSSLSCNNIVVSSSNTSLIAISSVAISGSVPNCSLAITPVANQFGNATLSISVKDSLNLSSASKSLVVNVTHLDRSPVASGVLSPSTLQEDTFGSITLGYSDLDNDKASACSVTLPSNLTLSAPCSCNASGVCSVGIMGAANFNGSANLSYSVTANRKVSASTNANLNISAVNDLPVFNLSAASLSLANNGNGIVNATISDIDNTLSCSNITLSSNNSSLLPLNNLSVIGTAPNCTIRIKAGLNQSGSGIVTALLSDGSGGSISKTVSVAVQTGFVPVGVVIPAKIEAENFDRSYDTTSGNKFATSHPTCNRTGTNTDFNQTPDVGGGCQIGEIAQGEYVEFDVYTLVAKNFDIKIRAASGSGGQPKIKVLLDGKEFSNNVVGVNSNGWTVFNDYTISFLPISAGNHTLRFIFLDGMLDFNYFNVVENSDALAVTSSNVSPLSINEDTDTLITLNYTDSNGDKATSCNISADVNLIVTQNCSCDAAGICKVGLIGVDNYNGVAKFSYSLVTNGKQSNISDVSLNISAVNDAPKTILNSSKLSLAFSARGEVATVLSDIDSTVTCSNLTASSSNTSLISNSNISIGGTFPNCVVNVTASSMAGSGYITLVANDGQGGISSKQIDVLVNSTKQGAGTAPGIIQASKFDRNYDIEVANLGEAGCTNGTTGVDMAINTYQWDSFKGKCYVGWTKANEYLEYDINVLESGNYDIVLGVASGSASKTVKILMDGSDISGNLTSPNVGWNIYREVSVLNKALTKGQHVLKVLFVTGDVNFSYIRINRAGFTDQTIVLGSDARTIMYPGETQEITLTYANSAKDLAQYCQVSEVVHLTLAKPCECNDLGVCKFSVTAENNYSGDARAFVKASGGGIISINNYGNNINLVIIKQNSAPSTYFLDTVLAQKDQSTQINLSYTDADGDIANMCSVANLSNLTITSPCFCFLGICSVGVKGASGYTGPASFSYKVMDNFLYSNETTVAFNIQSSVTREIASTQTVLPIEVFTHDGQKEVEDAIIYADESFATATDLFLRVHRGRWVEDGEFADKGAKMSVSINDGAFYAVTGDKYADSYETWGVYDPARPNRDQFAMTPGSVECVKADAQFGGCLVGSYHTVRFKIKLNKLGTLKKGANKISFRLEATDGNENGFRVLNIDVLAGNKSVLIPNQFVQDNPDNWTPPLNTAQDIAAGKNLFQNGVLSESPLNRGHVLRAKCSSCHATDGRDLSYFNFSNKSIEYRSMFHGLTELEGKQIASYIRSLNLKIPNGYSQKDLGRPWNPPYQPGPGLDSKPQLFWSAGAGLDAVLDDDSQMRDYLFSGAKTTPFPGREKTYSINGYNGYANPRELPQAFQFPDWMMWLPKIAPEDRVANLADWLNSDWYKNYAWLRDTALPDETIKNQVIYQHHYFHLLKLANSQQPTFITNWDVTPDNYTREQSLAATREYMNMQTHFALRQWELLNTFELEEIQAAPWQTFAKNDSEMIGQRQWPIFARNVFHLAPHFSGPMNTAYPNKLNNGVAMFNWTPVGQYFSTCWYTMQMILNPGYRMGAGQEHPVDWNYHPNHIGHATNYGLHFPKQPYRWFASVQFRTQIQRDDMLTNPANNYWARSLYSFRHIFDGLGVAMSDNLPRDKQIELDNQSIITILEEMEHYDPSVFPRKGSGLNGQESHFFEPADYVIPITSNGFEDDFYGRKATRWFQATRSANDSGIPVKTVERMKAFGKKMWPLSDWDSIDTTKR